jgi:hypothetical protein
MPPAAYLRGGAEEVPEPGNEVDDASTHIATEERGDACAMSSCQAPFDEWCDIFLASPSEYGRREDEEGNPASGSGGSGTAALPHGHNLHQIFPDNSEFEGTGEPPDIADILDLVVRREDTLVPLTPPAKRVRIALAENAAGQRRCPSCQEWMVESRPVPTEIAMPNGPFSVLPISLCHACAESSYQALFDEHERLRALDRNRAHEDSSEGSVYAPTECSDCDSSRDDRACDDFAITHGSDSDSARDDHAFDDFAIATPPLLAPAGVITSVGPSVEAAVSEGQLVPTEVASNPSMTDSLPSETEADLQRQRDNTWRDCSVAAPDTPPGATATTWPVPADGVWPATPPHRILDAT